MRKRTYRTVLVKQVDVQQLVEGARERLILGCDAAKAVWYGAWMNEQGEVLQTMRWDLVTDTAAVLRLVQQLRDAGRAVDVAVEPTGTYADALVAQMRRQGVDVYRVNAKHAHDYQEIYDGVPSGHDAKAAAIIAKLHLERGSQSRRWDPIPPARRELRVRVDALDWIKQDEQRYLSRLESRLARFAGQFAGILRFDCPDEHHDSLLEDLKGFNNLNVQVVREVEVPDRKTKRLSLDIMGNHRPGFMRQVATAITRAGGNMVELSSERDVCPQAGHILFRAVGTIEVVEDFDEAQLGKALEALGSDLSVSVKPECN